MYDDSARYLDINELMSRMISLSPRITSITKIEVYDHAHLALKHGQVKRNTRLGSQDICVSFQLRFCRKDRKQHLRAQWAETAVQPNPPFALFERKIPLHAP